METVAKKAGKPAVKKRTEADLLNAGKKGHLMLFIRKAYALSAMSKFKHTDWDGREKIACAGSFYGKVKESGPYEQLDEKSEEFKKLIQLAKSAKEDLLKKTNTKAVGELLNAVINLKSPTSTREFSVDILKGITL